MFRVGRIVLFGLLVGFLVASSACRKTPSGKRLVGKGSVTLTPTAASVKIDSTQQFNAKVAGLKDTTVSWSVNGIAGGDATVGTISVTGLYKAPSKAPSPATVTVGVKSTADTTKRATASVTVVGAK